MMSLTFGPFTQVSGSGPLGPLVNIGILSQTEQPHQCSSSKASMQTHMSLTFIYG